MRGSSLAELLFSLLLSSVAVSMGLRVVHGSLKHYHNLKLEDAKHYALERIESLLRQSFAESQKLYVPGSVTLHPEGNISVHPKRGRLTPASNSNAISFLNLDPTRFGAKQKGKHWLKIGLKGYEECEEKCASSRAVAIPILDKYTIYLAKNGTLRRLSHITGQNQPLEGDIESLQIRRSKGSHFSHFDFKIRFAKDEKEQQLRFSIKSQTLSAADLLAAYASHD